MKRFGADRASGVKDRLSALSPGQSTRVTGMGEELDASTRRRLEALGFRRGSEVTCLRRAPLGCPILYRVCGAEICLRKAQARAIGIDPAPASVGAAEPAAAASSIGGGYGAEAGRNRVAEGARVS